METEKVGSAQEEQCTFWLSGAFTVSGSSLCFQGDIFRCVPSCKGIKWNPLQG